MGRGFAIMVTFQQSAFYKAFGLFVFMVLNVDDC